MNQQAGNKKAQAYQMLRSNRATEALLEKVCKRHKKDAEAWMLLGCVHGVLSNPTDAITCLREANDLPGIQEKISAFMKIDILKGSIPERDGIASVDGIWVRKETNWRSWVSDDLLEKCNTIN